jgi:tRNA-specific 2-thiouridylase
LNQNQVRFSNEDQSIGEHEGAVFYTIGQRHGFTITKNTAHNAPYYIIAKDIATNTLIVSQKPQEDALKRVTDVQLKSINWISNIPQENKTYGARIRYRQEKQECRIKAIRLFLSNPNRECHLVNLSSSMMGQSVLEVG